MLCILEIYSSPISYITEALNWCRFCTYVTLLEQSTESLREDISKGRVLYFDAML
jgi:hypothetical protein